MLKQAGTKTIVNGKTVCNVLIESGKNLKSLALKSMMVTTCEYAGREGLN